MKLNKWNIQCILFGHIWVKKDGKWVCKRCGVPQ